ncbi:hypothetical protein [Pseudomonas protegens]|uniref:hypothetical protein n=1 Tax=Pseudomonas protegens TaxID=380021 RepID=UPI0032079CCE
MSSDSFRIVSFTQNGSSVLPPRNFMLVGQYLESPSKQYKLILEADGNLRLYDNGVPIWVADSSVPYTYVDSRPNKDLVTCFYMQGGAILVDRVNSRTWIALNSWIPVKQQKGRADRTYLQLQDDGNIVTVDGVPMWARFGFTPTAEPRPGKLIYDTGTNKGPSEWKVKDWTFNNIF